MGLLGTLFKSGSGGAPTVNQPQATSGGTTTFSAITVGGETPFWLIALAGGAFILAAMAVLKR